MTSVQNLQKKHALLEADVGSHQDRIEGIKSAASHFIERGHFDSDNIEHKQKILTDRYAALQVPMAVRKQRLLDSLQVQQLYRDIEDEEAWIREKEPVAASTNRGESSKWYRERREMQKELYSIRHFCVSNCVPCAV